MNALATAHIEGFVTDGRIKQISRLHPRELALNELATSVNRSPVDLRQRLIKSMVDEGKILERRYLQQPNHQQQAYRTREP